MIVPRSACSHPVELLLLLLNGNPMDEKNRPLTNISTGTRPIATLVNQKRPDSKQIGTPRIALHEALSF